MKISIMLLVVFLLSINSYAKESFQSCEEVPRFTENDFIKALAITTTHSQIDRVEAFWTHYEKKGCFLNRTTSQVFNINITDFKRCNDVPKYTEATFIKALAKTTTHSQINRIEAIWTKYEKLGCSKKHTISKIDNINITDFNSCDEVPKYTEANFIKALAKTTTHSQINRIEAIWTKYDKLGCL